MKIKTKFFLIGLISGVIFTIFIYFLIALLIAMDFNNL